MTNGPATSITSATAAAKPAMATSVTFTLRRNGSPSSPALSRVRWGRIDVCTAWKSCSGARAISSTLNANPARAAPSAPPSVALTSSGPALRNVCSQSMISSTATANPAPWERVNWPSRSGSSSRAAGGGRRCIRATGTTTSDSNGAAAMPSATNVCPDAIPIATASANSARQLASMNTSPPYSVNWRCPAR